MLSKNEKFILDKLNEYGEGYVVGGWCRDTLLGKKPKDVDFTTNIDFQILKDLFKEFKPKKMGKTFSITQIKIDGIEYEIAYFSNDLKQNLSRRDFTINAIAYNGEKYIDYFGGMNDLDRKIIRFTQNAKAIILDDYLRMLRAARFSTILNFEIEKQDFEIIKKHSHFIKKVAPERIQMEINKILLSDSVIKGFELLHYANLLKYVIPELDKCFGFNQKNPHHDKDLAYHILEVTNFSKKDLITRLAALLHDIGKIDCYFEKNNIGHFYGHEETSAKIAEKILLRLKYDNSTIEKVYVLIENHMNKGSEISNKICKRLINKIGTDNLENFYDLLKSDIMGHKPPFNFEDLNNFINKCNEIIESKQPISRFDLAINGKDIMTILEIKQGKEIGDLINKCTEFILDNPYNNTKEKLIEYIKTIT